VNAKAERRESEPVLEPSSAAGYATGDLDRALAGALARLDAASLTRRLRRFDGAPGPRMRVDGRDVLMLAGSNPLDLAADPRVRAAAEAATAALGTAAGGARLISGNLPLHESLERDLAAHCGTQAALLFSTGYMANLGVLTALAGPGDILVSDALNHASTIDACRLSGAAVRVFRHGDPDDLARIARDLPATGRRLLVVDGVYSMDGERAPLAALAPIARAHDMAIVVDDAHGIGVLGPTGGGAAEDAGVAVDVQIGNLGKALGSFGAFVACSHTVREWLVQTARPFIFTCGLPPGAVAAAQRALRIVREEPLRRRAALAMTARLAAGLRAAGLSVVGDATHITGLLTGENERTMELCERALASGVFAQGIRYPSVPRGGARIRLTPMCSHTPAEIDAAIDVLASLSRALLVRDASAHG
jgi:8-amino-7-oxononanoate synthase